MLSENISRLREYEENKYGDGEVINEEHITEDKQFLEGLLAGKLGEAGTTGEVIEDMEYYQALHQDESIKDSTKFFYCEYRSDNSMFETPQDVVNHLNVCLEKYDKGTRQEVGDLDNACESISEEQPKAVEAAMLLKIVINGE